MSEAKTARELIEDAMRWTVRKTRAYDLMGEALAALDAEQAARIHKDMVADNNLIALQGDYGTLKLLHEAEQKIVICTGCGRTANWYDEDDFGSFDSESGICCHDCGKEEFLTIEELYKKLVAEQALAKGGE